MELVGGADFGTGGKSGRSIISLSDKLASIDPSASSTSGNEPKEDEEAELGIDASESDEGIEACDESDGSEGYDSNGGEGGNSP